MSHVQPTRRQPALICSSQRRMDVMSPLRVFGGARTAVQTLGRAAMVQAHEAALLMSGAATAPRRLVGGGYEQASSMSPHAATHPGHGQCC
jgi:triacylglycerol lipase